MSPVLAGLLLWSLRSELLGSGKGVKFIHFDDLSGYVFKHLFVSKLCLLEGSVNPTLHGSGMNLLNTSDGLVAQTFQDLMNCPLDFIFRSLDVIESCTVPVAEGLSAKLAAKNCSHTIAG